MTRLRSIRFRLTLWYAGLLAITLAIVLAIVYFALREVLYENLEESLEARADIVSGLAVHDGELEVADLAIPGDPLEGEEFVRIYDVDGNVIYDNSSPDFPPPHEPEAIADALDGSTRTFVVGVNGLSLRVRASPLETGGETVGAVEIGLSEDDVGDTLSQLRLIFAVVYPAALIVTTLGGILLATGALAPIDTITRAARKINAEDLSQRIDATGLPDDEVGRLARTFNEMIARLDEAFRRQRQFTADASHELRTPLTAASGQIEVALQRERSPEEYREVLQRVNSEVDRMIRLVGSLLTLARADAGQLPLGRQQVSLREISRVAVAQVQAAALARRIGISIDDSRDVVVPADEDLLLQLLLNLLDNAVKYSPEGRAVNVGWTTDSDFVEITVSDTGSGIAPEHLPYIFDRFYRADASRAGGSAGLGLSICRWIAEAHGGTIAVRSSGVGTTFTVRLPIH